MRRTKFARTVDAGLSRLDQDRHLRFSLHSADHRLHLSYTALLNLICLLQVQVKSSLSRALRLEVVLVSLIYPQCDGTMD